MSGWAAILFWWSLPFLSCTEVLAADLLIAWKAPHRELYPLRVAFLCGIVAVVCLGVGVVASRDGRSLELLGGQGSDGVLLPILAASLLFGILLVVTISFIRFCYDIGRWSALFCATCAYALQNFGSGLGETIRLVSLACTGAFDERLIGVVSLVCCIATYLLFYALLMRNTETVDLDSIVNREFLPMLSVVIVGVICFDVVIKSAALAQVDLSVRLALRLFHGLICLFTLYTEFDMVLRRRITIEMETTRNLMEERERQLMQSRENIDAINIKCHDLRHQIRHLADGGAMVDSEVLADIAREVSVYDSAIRTGNQALDTILTEKSFLCERAGITLTCMADGHALDELAPAELYALLGNALDNAIEATQRVPNPERRSISLLIRQVVGMVQLHLENSCLEDVSLVDGLPQTSKLAADGSRDTTSHGFGTRSMRAIVESHGGTITFTPSNGSFALDAMIPVERIS